MSSARWVERHNSGFTIVEMLVVFAIVALATSAAVVLIRQPSPALQLQSAARKVCAALRLARAQAIAGNTEMSIEFDLRNGTYNVGSMAAEALPKGVVATLTFAESERDDAKVGRIRFYPSGAATGGEISLAFGNRRTTMSVNWLTGVARCNA